MNSRLIIATATRAELEARLVEQEAELIHAQAEIKRLRAHKDSPCECVGESLPIAAGCPVHDLPANPSDLVAVLRDLVTFAQESEDFTDPAEPGPYAALKLAEIALAEVTRG